MENTYGLLIDYEYCTGCQSCEVACKEEHNYPVGKWGIRVHDDGPWEIEENMINWNKLPFPTDLCDLCAARTAVGREPTCAHHCLANVIVYGTIAELAPKLAEKPKQVLFVPQFKPLEARGKFEPRNKLVGKVHHAAAIEVTENRHFTTSSQRSDSRTDVGIDEA